MLLGANGSKKTTRIIAELEFYNPDTQRGAAVRTFIRLHITAEGQPEERFVKDTLTTPLGSFHISTDVRRVLTSRDKGRHIITLGGLFDFLKKTCRHFSRWLKTLEQLLET